MFETVGVVYIAALIIGGSITFILMGKGPPGRFLSWLDDLVYAGEKTIVATSLAVMSVLVFADVVWSTAHDTDATRGAIFIAVIFGLCLLGGYTARRDAPVSLGKKLLSGVVAFVLLFVVGVLIYMVPNGFGWSQRVALCLMLWVGLLGASMATHEGRHIAVDAVRRIVPEHLKRSFEFAAGVVTVAISLVLTVLSVMYVRENWHEWISSEMTAGIFESVPIPYWAATLAIPIGFGIMALRFVNVTLHGAKESDLLASLGGGPEE